MTTNNKLTTDNVLKIIAALDPSFVADWIHLEAIKLFVRMWNGDPEVPNLLVAMFPGLGKTQLFSILLPAVVLALDFKQHILELSNNDLLAGINSTNLLRIVKSKEFMELAPQARLKETQRDIIFEGSDGRPAVHSASINGTVLGFRSTLLVV
jgi:hypothetical protein